MKYIKIYKKHVIWRNTCFIRLLQPAWVKWRTCLFFIYICKIALRKFLFMYILFQTYTLMAISYKYTNNFQDSINTFLISLLDFLSNVYLILIEFIRVLYTFLICKLQYSWARVEHNGTGIKLHALWIFPDETV